jgi:GNAT superfamily N-acetyltransferase
MNSPQFDVGILSRPEDVGAFVEQVQTASDAERDSLGFLPDQVYKAAADQGELLVAVVQEGKESIYTGHLLYGGVFPQARIFQVFTAPQFRLNGIGRRLVEAIVRRAESLQFMSVLANVADNLAANHFWERLSFEVVRYGFFGKARNI